MKILVACEFSGIVRDAFAEFGHDVMSCDLLPTERPGKHYQGEVENLIRHLRPGDIDMMIAFPPCTHLAASGARWWPHKQDEQAEALNFVRYLMDAKIPRIAIENPVGRISSAIRKPDQIIQPWMFGHGEVKTTCLWLKGLPLLAGTKSVSGREQRCWRMGQSKDRAKERSRTYPGIAHAMAHQWGTIVDGLEQNNATVS